MQPAGKLSLACPANYGWGWQNRVSHCVYACWRDQGRVFKVLRFKNSVPPLAAGVVLESGTPAAAGLFVHIRWQKTARTSVAGAYFTVAGTRDSASFSRNFLVATCTMLYSLKPQSWCMVTTFSRLDINRSWLQFLLVVSWKGKTYLLVVWQSRRSSQQPKKNSSM